MDFDASPALQALYRQVQADLALLSYAQREWVLPRTDASGQPVYDAVVIGGGQAGLGTALALQRDGVTNVLVLDGRPPGREGVWEDFARMSHLRTPREIVGIEGGIPSLSAPTFYRAAYGEQAWAGIVRIERTRWMEFLRWFRHASGLQIRNDTQCLRLTRHDNFVALRVVTGGVPQTVLARHVVLATGFDGCGAWRVPAGIAQAVGPSRINHSSDAIDFAALRDKRVGVLSHGAAAFDNAVVALQYGAGSLDLGRPRSAVPRLALG